MKKIYDAKRKHFQALELLGRIMLLLGDCDDAKLQAVGAHTAIVDAAKHGIVEFVVDGIKLHPPLICDIENIFRTAVTYRQEKIFSLMYGLGPLKSRISRWRDDSDNGMLHLAGDLAPSWRLDRVSGAALQFQRELQWFKVIVSPLDRVVLCQK